MKFLNEALDNLFGALHKYRCFVNRSSVRPRWDAGYHYPVLVTFWLNSAAVTAPVVGRRIPLSRLGYVLVIYFGLRPEYMLD